MDSRIRVLDTFRTIAILVVIIYHYYYRWGPLLAYEGVPFFEIGKYGVHFFFVISGFVIYYTLQKKVSVWAFYRARLIRLLPTMIIFSSITFFFFQIFPLDIHPRFNTKWSDLLANWTFVDPVLLNRVFGTRFTYVEPAYWSLWFEVRFYLWVGVIFFLDRKNFIRNWMAYTVILNLWMYLPNPGVLKEIGFYVNYLLPVEWINYFTLGVLFFHLYSEKVRPQLVYYLLLVFILESMRIKAFGHGYNYLAFSCILAFFVLFTFKMPLPKFFENRWMVKTGQASYGLYLIHQNVGIALIYFLLNAFPVHPIIVCLIVAGLFVALAILSFEYIEKPIIGFLRKKMGSG